MLYVVLFFLAVSLLLYVLLAGADFGAGIVELFSSKTSRDLTKKTVYRVIGPVWEANHIWIIIVVVVLWVGFPGFYNILMVYLHIPLTLILLGITLRGVAFVFRHYDAYKDKTQLLYDWMFRISSLLTPIFLGVTFSGLISGNLVLTEDLATTTFYTAYISSWFNLFSFFVGLFFAGICAFLASILLIGETDTTERPLYVAKARISTISVIVLGFIVLCIGYFQNKVFVMNFVESPYSIFLIALSAVIILPLLKSIKNQSRIKTRALAGIQVLLILSAAFSSLFPELVITKDGSVNIMNTVATNEVIKVLGIALIIGGAIILPGVFHLMKSFKMIKLLER
ncbi:cytochrome d ubiquinol oxidase subunit II [Seonamhaeicola marinus]|uniref:Cytochrome d ubiquinol oxidase subunit II n=1 Tax=Seonamhaeicola marinus TaxID=1912246 RepID=A0A5D0HLD5_9FLAO|nr:cytochrome d ubiquinol oxidase subunit II [Seonamhaeicola marinus]TYA71790.1 cytochrome d ubiquinol oxidase subunit II [Seonamhaeicola marinus]